MTVAVLFPGPSVATFWDDDMFDMYDMVVGVNSTFHHFRTRWGAAVDKNMVEPMVNGKTPCRPTEGMLTNSAWRQHVGRLRLKHVLPEPYHGVFMPPGTPSDRCGYTSVSALWFGLHKAQGAPVDVFGMDFAIGKPGFASEQGDHSRRRWVTESRWLRCYWAPNIVVHGLIDPEILAFIRGERNEFPNG